MNIKYNEDESISKSILNFSFGMNSASLHCYVLAILRQEARAVLEEKSRRETFRELKILN